ncbi:MAG: hypothetical protein WA118_14380 [Carboxydocellales bacterium]
MNEWKPKGLATGIGSLPHSTADQALAMINKYFTRFPHWPQLPQGEVREGFVEQSAYPLIAFGLAKVMSKPGENERLAFLMDQRSWTENLTEFYSQYLAAVEGDVAALDKFAFPRDGVQGFYAFLENLQHPKEEAGVRAQLLKGQVSGPITVGFVMTDHERRAAYYHSDLRDVIVKTVELQAKWQLQQLKALGLPVLISIDEPGIYACGLSTHITLTKEMIQQDLRAIIDTIHQGGGLTGVHVCAGADWSIVLETEVDVLFLDTYEYFESLAPYTEVLGKFLDRGGVVGWGIVPTSDKVHGESVDNLFNKLQGQLEILVKRGLPVERLINQALITPSCGTGLLSLDTAQKIYVYTAGIAEKWNKL